MNYTFITLHNEELCTIIDASIPNKSQNQAVKVQINRACDQLMNRISEGWLLDKSAASDETKDDQIKRMVDRFLAWKLPENFNPDCGISFKKDFNENTPHPMKHEPTGTNLFDASQAEEMIRYMLEAEK
jgi:hypothetical protein